MKFPSKEKLRAARIVNPWELTQCGTFPCFISWSPRKSGRCSQAARYQVVHLEKDTDPTGPWYNYGKKTFTIFTDTKEQALEKAIRWADEEYGKHEWVRSPWGDYVDKSCLAPAIAAVTAHQKSLTITPECSSIVSEEK